MNTLELEKTYLAKFLPADLCDAPVKEVEDIYVTSAQLTILRLRKKGDTYEITKKYPTSTSDFSSQVEETISLTEDEYRKLSVAEGERLRKLRCYYPVGENTAEVDVFLDDLEGLVLIDFEFTSQEKLDAFTPPDFCLIDVSQDNSIAGGNLAGKSYSQIESKLLKYNYSKIEAVSSSTVRLSSRPKPD